MTGYWLQIVFKSNERPWHHSHYSPPTWAPKMTRAEAISWAAYMQDNMPDYQITLYEDGKVLAYEAQQEATASAAQPRQDAGG